MSPASIARMEYRSADFALPRTRRRSAVGRSPGLSLFGLAQHPENLLELRADRQVERLAGRQTAQEPLVVELGQPALARHAGKRALDQRGESGIVAPINQAIGIVG